MKRAIVLLALGIFGTALLISVVTVYVLHDVDRDQIDHLNGAFVGLCVESLIFTLSIVFGVAVATLLWRYFAHLNAYAPRGLLALYLGAGVTVLQYLWDFSIRKFLPRLSDLSLGVYLLLAIGICATVLCRDIRQQARQSAQETVSG